MRRRDFSMHVCGLTGTLYHPLDVYGMWDQFAQTTNSTPRTRALVAALTAFE
jgi:hypothetical protein